MARRRRKASGSSNTPGMPLPSIPKEEIKMVPKKGETSAEAVTRGQRRHPGMKVTDPPPNRGNSYATGRGIQIVNPRNVGQNPWLHPLPVIHKAGVSGITEGTQIIRDQFANKQLVYYTCFRANMWQPTIAGTNHYLQQGSVTTDATVDGAVGGVLQNLYSTIARQYMAVRGRVFPTFTVTNAAPGQIAILSYLQSYTEAFFLIRNLEGLLNIGNYNFATQLISNAAFQRMIQIRGLANRLRSFPMPQALVDYLDMLCGPKARNEDEPLFLANVISDQVSTTAIDISTAANLDTIITRANNVLNLIVTGIYTTSSQDLAAIMQLFGLAYGFPSLPEKEINFDIGEWSLIMNQAHTGVDSTAHSARTYPNILDATVGMTNLVPVLHPKGVDSPSTELLYTLIRPAAYSADAVGGILSTGNTVNQVGLIVNQLQAGII
jgi:hypothetical protein